MQDKKADPLPNASARQYRPDIDGMRALAVGLVVLHHIGLEFFSGGYIGVDVFFVLSGYLITSIIFPAIARGKFSYGDFFARRIKRLGPVLAVVVISTLLVAPFILLPTQLELLGSSAIYVSVFLGNFFFWRNYGGYFADDAQSAPLLHTWSLAVEEQYYLLWPLSLVIALRVLGPRNTVILACVSLPALVYLSEIGTRMTIGAAYYLLPTRFFELMVGSVLALLQIPHWLATRVRLYRLLASPISALGLGLIVYGAIKLQPDSPFPGFNALLPVAGSALLLCSQPGLANRLLSISPMPYLGKLSYSLYLWHWPVIAFMHYSGIRFETWEKMAGMGIALLLSVASYHCVENPLRRRTYRSKKQIFSWLYVAPTLLIAALATIFVVSAGLPDRFDEQVVMADRAVAKKVHEQRTECHSPARDWRRNIRADCKFGTTANKPQVLVLGDSHANHLVPFLSEFLQPAGLSGIDYTMDRCPALFALQYGVNAAIGRQCAERNALAARAIQSGVYQYVVIAASWPDFNTSAVHKNDRRLMNDGKVEEALTAALTTTLQTITDSGATPILIRETPTLEGVSPICPLQRQIFGAELDCRSTLTRNRWLDGALPEVAQEFTGLVILDPSNMLCGDANRCEMTIERIPLYSDDNHFNAVGSSMMGVRYLNRNGNPFSASDENLSQ